MFLPKIKDGNSICQTAGDAFTRMIWALLACYTDELA